MATATATRPAGRAKRAPRLDWLSPQDRREYRIIPDAVDFVPHSDFPKPGIERELFGQDAERIDVPRWRPYAELDDPHAAPPKARRQLTRHHEAVLFMRYNYARCRLAELTTAQGRRFSRGRALDMLRWARRAQQVRGQLAGANMALVVAMAKRTRINSVEFGELVSEGNMALLRSLEKFDVSRGFKFSTYACRAILKSFNRMATKAGNYRQHFPTEFVPDLERSDEIERRHADQRDLALEDLHRILMANVAGLSSVERRVVGARFAVGSYHERQTLEQVGRIVGLSKERVRQVQNDALVKLRSALEGQAA